MTVPTKASEVKKAAEIQSAKDNEQKVAAKAETKPKADKREALLFAGSAGFCKGGINDLRFRGTVGECKEHFTAHAPEFRVGPQGTDTWAHIVDADTLEVLDSANLSVNDWARREWSV